MEALGDIFLYNTRARIALSIKTKNAFQLISFTLPLVFQRQIYYLFLFSRAFGSSARGCLTWYGSLLRRSRFLLLLRLCFLLLWLFTHRRGLVDLHKRVNVRIVVVCKSTVLLSADDIRFVCSFKDEVVFETVPGVAIRFRSAIDGQFVWRDVFIRIFKDVIVFVQYRFERACCIIGVIFGPT